MGIYYIKAEWEKVYFYCLWGRQRMKPSLVWLYLYITIKFKEVSQRNFHPSGHFLDCEEKNL